MTARTVLGPHGYSRPPYGSFASKPLYVPVRTYTQTFTVLGPHGYSRPPYGSFAGKTPQASTVVKAAGWIGKRKRWWEELQEEYQERWESERPLAAPSKSKKAIAARKVAEDLIEDAIESNLVREDNALELAALAIAVQRATKLTETLKYADQLKKQLKKLQDEEEEELMLLMAIL